MLTPVELAALVTATKGSIDIFDKIAGQIRSVFKHRAKEEVVMKVDGNIKLALTETI